MYKFKLSLFTLFLNVDFQVLQVLFKDDSLSKDSLYFDCMKSQREALFQFDYIRFNRPPVLFVYKRLLPCVSSIAHVKWTRGDATNWMTCFYYAAQVGKTLPKQVMV